MNNPFSSILTNVLSIGASAEDTEDTSLRKKLIVAGSLLVIPATALWGMTYLLFDEPSASAVSLFYSIISMILLFRFGLNHNPEPLIAIQLGMGLIFPFLSTILLGKFTNSSCVILWSMISALGATTFYAFRKAVFWWLGFFALLLLTGLLQPVLRSANNLPSWLVSALFVMNIAGFAIIVLLLLVYFIRQKDRAYRLLHIERQKAENLLRNILPEKIAVILENEKRTIAESFDEASVLFADMVGFSNLTARMMPVEMVNLLNEIFSYFDSLVDKYGLEKIRTIGDNYMVVSGVPEPRQDHARALACMALEMREYLNSLPPIADARIEFRIGINSGPVVGGVIGQRKFVYDVWGDAVNIASRMESQGIAGQIQIGQATYDLIHPWFICEPRGPIQVKGRGEVVHTYILRGLKVGESQSL